MENAKLIEPGMKSFIKSALKKSRNIKLKYYNFYFNISLAIIFVLSISGFLIYKWKGKLTPLEKQIKLKKQKQQIFEKLKTIEHIKNDKHMITDLPKWNM